MHYFQNLFLFNKSQDSFLRPLGSGLSIAVPIILSFFLKDIRVASLGILGSFAYLSFQKKSVSYNINAISLHGFLLFTSFSLGLYTVSIPWIIPFSLSIIFFSSFVLTKIYHIPKPNYSFIIMLFAMGISMPATNQIFDISFYLFFGIGGALFSGIFISLLEKLPLKIKKTTYEQLSFKDKYYITIYEFPDLFIKAINFSTILFCSAYIAYLLKDYNGQWVLISASSVLAGEDTQKIKERSLQRIIGTIIGLIIGSILLTFDLPTVVQLLLLIPLNIGVEYFMSRNYAIANIFINPQVILLVNLVSPIANYTVIYSRFINLIIGVCLSMSLILLSDYSIKIFKKNF